MVLEMLINPKRAERTPWEMFFLGFAYALVAILLSLWIFDEGIGIVMVFLTVLSCTYLIQGTLRLEARKGDAISDEVSLLREHSKALSFMMFLFFGFTVAFSIVYIFSPTDLKDKVFDVQIKTINNINGGIEGNFFEVSGFFATILVNNLKVLFFSFVFAFFYGAGAIFILAWNAAIVGTAIGAFVRGGLASLAQDVGLPGVGAYLSTYSLGLLRYMTHGWLEILAYFTGALAGGLISIAIVKHEYESPEFRRTLIDAAGLGGIAVVVLIFAAAVEVFITPILF